MRAGTSPALTGYEMYLQLLEEAVLEEKGEKKVSAECAADLTISANIPEKYVPSPEQRMDLYRRIAAIRTQEDASDLLDELMDRYGDPPKPVYALLDVAMLRASASQAGISDISQRGDKLRFVIADFDPQAVLSVCGAAKYRQRLDGEFEPGAELHVLPDGCQPLGGHLGEDLPRPRPGRPGLLPPQPGGVHRRHRLPHTAGPGGGGPGGGGPRQDAPDPAWRF